MRLHEFHQRDGWSFLRLEGGAVRIKLERPHQPDVTHTIPPSEWVSVVAAVAPNHGVSEEYAAAENLHITSADHKSNEVLTDDDGFNAIKALRGIEEKEEEREERRNAMNERDKLARCVGCRNDFYNDKNPQGVKRCWSFENAAPVTRYRLDWWTPPTARESFTRVETLACHHSPGRYQDYDEIPAHLAAPSAVRPAPTEEAND